MNVLVLGAGRVGAAIARDLHSSGDHAVTAADRAAAALAPLADRYGIATVAGDLANTATVRELADGFDLVVGALPAALGFRAAEAVIASGRPMVDISFFDEDPFDLDAAARAAGVPIVVDAGISPGLSNLIFGRDEAEADGIDRFVCYVGGLPARPSGIWGYKAPFSPADVIELYTRPARYREGGVQRTVPALSDLRELDVPGAGRFEAFLTDGLRTMLRKTDVPDMREMTLRYPGHAAKARLLREIGLFDEREIDVAGARISPRALVERVLFPAWTFEPGEQDLTVFRVEVDLRRGGRAERRIYQLLDRYDSETDVSSMARTTGYTCTAIAHLVASGTWRTPGVAPLETIGASPGCFDFVRRHLADRGVRLDQTTRATRR